MGGVFVDFYILDMVWIVVCVVVICWVRVMNIYYYCIVIVLFLVVVGDIGLVLNMLWSFGFELVLLLFGFFFLVVEFV